MRMIRARRKAAPAPARRATMMRVVLSGWDLVPRLRRMPLVFVSIVI